MKQPIIAPSVLSANFANLQADFNLLNNSVADFIHIDVMDGVFVPNISFGMSVIKAMRKLTTKTFDVHLMIVEPDKYIDDFKAAGADILTVHYEACTHLHRTIQKIKQSGMKAGVAINPHTPVSFLDSIIKDVDLICLMSVNPGFGGQQFIEKTYDKVSTLRDLVFDNGSDALIEVDGGIGFDNAKKLLQCGATVLVAGNTVFSSEDPINAIHKLKNILA